MNDLLSGMGSAVEGGLFARALEPDSGAREPHPDQPDDCQNCGAALDGAYCSACGQRGHVHRTIGAFLHELLHGALHFEGKLWRTLPMLVLRPGRLTRRYIDGERSRFVSPMALFLFTVFLMFAAFQIVGIGAPSDIDDAIDQPMTKAVAARDAKEAELAGLPSDAREERAEIAEEIDALDRAIAAIDAGRDYEFADVDGNRNYSRFNLTGIPSIDEGIVKKWRSNPSLMLYKLQANAYKFSWILIPLSIPFMYLLFLFRRRFAGYDHAIFVTYSLSFVTLLFIVASLLGVAGVSTGPLVLALMGIVPIHLYKQLRHGYELTRWGAFWRLMMLSAFIYAIVTIFLLVLLGLGAF